MSRWIHAIVGLIFSITLVYADTTKNSAKLVGEALTPAPLGSVLHPIVVGVTETPPYVYQDGDRYRGIAIELWEHIANRYQWHYRYINVGHNYTDVAKNVDRFGYDIAIGNFSATYKRLQWVDFSPPYLLNHISILTYTKEKHIFSAVISTFVNSMLPILFVVLGVFIFASLLFWYLEHKRHRYAMSESMFCTSIAMLSGNVVDIPSTNINRVVFICILIAGVVLQAVVIATITDASMRFRLITDPFADGASFNNKYFVVESGSSFASLIYNRGGHVKEVSGGARSALDFYKKNQKTYDGFVVEHTVANYYKKMTPDKRLMVSDINLSNDLLHFFYNKSFVYQKVVSENIYYMQANGEAKNICERYLGAEASLCVL